MLVPTTRWPAAGGAWVRPPVARRATNGPKSVIAALGTENFLRTRLGVGEPPHPDYDTADWVPAPQREGTRALAQAAERAADAVSARLRRPGAGMNKYNRKPSNDPQTPAPSGGKCVNRKCIAMLLAGGQGFEALRAHEGRCKAQRSLWREVQG